MAKNNTQESLAHAGFMKSIRGINRRQFLRKTGAAAFGTVIAVSGFGRLDPTLAEACCTGPFGSGACPPSNCSGAACVSGGGATCGYITGFCPTGTACWSSGCGGTCCDCSCYYPPDPQTTFYCYCH